MVPGQGGKKQKDEIPGQMGCVTQGTGCVAALEMAHLTLRTDVSVISAATLIWTQITTF